jgi:ribonuclease VapC
MSIVLSGLLGRRQDVFLAAIHGNIAIEAVPFGAEHIAVVLDSWRRYGKDKHPGRLNFGDCIAYATAQSYTTAELAVELLVFVGDGFSQTDIATA